MALNTPRNVLEKLSSAMVSSNLKHKETLCDVDVIGAAGAAGIGSRNGRGSTILRMDLTLSHHDITAANRVAVQMLRELSNKNGWRIPNHSLHRIASEAIKLYICPACSVCHGRGLLYHKSERVRPCSGDRGCDGTGKRKLSGKWSIEVKALVAEMDKIRSQCGGRIRKQLGSRIAIED